MILAGNESNLEKARQTIAWFQKVFGDRYFIEIQNNGLRCSESHFKRRSIWPGKWACRLWPPAMCIIEAQDILLCVNTGKFRTDTHRWIPTNSIRSSEEMYAAFSGHEDAVARSQEIADRVDIELELGKRHFPVYTPPEGKISEDYLRELCLAGLYERYAQRPDRLADGKFSDEVTARLERANLT